MFFCLFFWFLQSGTLSSVRPSFRLRFLLPRHRWTLAGTLHLAGSSFIRALVYHIGGCKSLRMAKRQPLILITFAACGKRPLTTRVTWTWPKINDTRQPVEDAHDTTAPTVGQWAAVTVFCQLLVGISGIRVPNAVRRSDIGIGLLRRHCRRNDTCGGR